jgi:cytidyltransferase-like protein
MDIVLVTGGFDPLHSGHLAYFRTAAKLGHKLYVGLNSDEWLTRKKGRAFMPLDERRAIVGSLKDVYATITYDDSDGSSCEAIQQILDIIGPGDRVIFANGGDRTRENIPEMRITDPRVHFMFGVGGENKMNSSSWILEEWKSPKTVRTWGYYRVLHNVPGMKVKELTVNPGQSLSMQRHADRSEYWIVSEGRCVVNSMMPNGYLLPSKELGIHGEVEIPKGEWHQLMNPYDEPCRVVEIQYGDRCEEEDIERQ